MPALDTDAAVNVPEADLPAGVDDAITSRHSVRAFLDRPVGQETIYHLLEVARYAPSGTNTQPWHVHVVAGEARRRLCEAMLEEYRAAGDERHTREYHYYPTERAPVEDFSAWHGFEEPPSR